jgi:hypothetical protein
VWETFNNQGMCGVRTKALAQQRAPPSPFTLLIRT